MTPFKVYPGSFVLERIFDHIYEVSISYIFLHPFILPPDNILQVRTHTNNWKDLLKLSAMISQREILGFCNPIQYEGVVGGRGAKKFLALPDFPL